MSQQMKLIEIQFLNGRYEATYRSEGGQLHTGVGSSPHDAILSLLFLHSYVFGAEVQP